MPSVPRGQQRKGVKVQRFSSAVERTVFTQMVPSVAPNRMVSSARPTHRKREPARGVARDVGVIFVDQAAHHGRIIVEQPKGVIPTA
jgi:hypothetical protein